MLAGLGLGAGLALDGWVSSPNLIGVVVIAIVAWLLSGWLSLRGRAIASPGAGMIALGAGLAGVLLLAPLVMVVSGIVLGWRFGSGDPGFVLLIHLPVLALGVWWAREVWRPAVVPAFQTSLVALVMLGVSQVPGLWRTFAVDGDLDFASLAWGWIVWMVTGLPHLALVLLWIMAVRQWMAPLPSDPTLVERAPVDPERGTGAGSVAVDGS